MRWYLLALVAAGIGCGEPAGPGASVGLLRVHPLAQSYPAGATASHRLTNLGRTRLEYTPCFARGGAPRH